VDTASVIAVIPARYGSSRLPGKALADVNGVPMVVRVWRQVSKAQFLDRVIVATDDERIAAVVRDSGGVTEMTASTHQSGTDRIAEVARRIPADIYLNVQGDLPFIAPEDLDALAQPMRADPTIPMATIATPIVDAAEWSDPNVVKVVCDSRGDALYFSRSAIPFWRDSGAAVPAGALRHIGVYGYRRSFLFAFASWPAGCLEQIEKLEQLRVLERGYRIRVVNSEAPSLEVDTPEDLMRANAFARGESSVKRGITT
jgi:3-deoxy-manno-octulosonate cytidylyltransferase (CMP-KDO synthetase)